MSEQLAYDVREVAGVTPFSEATIKRAIHKRPPGDGEFPPPLPARLAGRKYVVLREDLDRWLRALPPS